MSLLDESYTMKEINLVSAVVHVIADTMRTVTGIIAGAVELGPDSDPRKVDAVASIIICVLIILGAAYVLRSALKTLRIMRYADNDNLLAISEAAPI